MYLIVHILHLDVPELQNFACDPQVQGAFLRHIETPGDSQSGKDYLVFIKCSMCEITFL